MNDQTRLFLALLGKPPARLTVEQTACLLNCACHDIPVLVAARVLKPLGSPPPNGIKYFATTVVLELVTDPAWLARMTNTLYEYWRGKNQRRKALLPDQRNSAPPLRRALEAA